MDNTREFGVVTRHDADMKWLVCEGTCNPSFVVYQDLETRFMQQRQHDAGPLPEDVQAMAMVVRALHHTAHVADGRSFGNGHTARRYRCSTCGHARRYGVEARSTWGATVEEV
jgi:hypothetical protein